MRDAGRATSAAPTYFEAARVTDATGRAYSLVDGGVFANNPAMCAYVDVICAKPGAEVLVLSLGTGELTRPFPHEKVKDWGLIEWARPLIDVVFDGISDTTDFQLRQVLGEGHYWRLQTELTKGRGSDDLDDSSKANIATLKRTGRELVEERSADLDAVCAALSA
jgi:hypothetical protein